MSCHHYHWNLAYGRTVKLQDGEARSSKKYETSERLIWERARKFTFVDILNATEDFNEKYRIGKGGFGTVYKAVSHRSSRSS